MTSTDMVRGMTGWAGGPRALSMRARVALFAVALATVPIAACQKDATLDPFLGPSELALSVMLTATPDVLPLDGASQSLVTILVRDGSGQVVANVTLRLQIRFGGALQDYGLLSARTLITGADGRAVAIYTAPLGGSVDTGSQVQIEVTPVGDNYASAVPRSLNIRLVPAGVVNPPQSFTAGFRFTPPLPARFQEILFETSCVSGTDPDCVRDGAGQIVSYAWTFGDGSTASGPSATHAYRTQSTFTPLLTVTDALGRTQTASRSVVVGTGGTPIARIAFSPAQPRIGDTVFFNASQSTGPAGRDIVSYDWDFGDGTTGSGVTVSHAYPVAATYGVTLTVTDEGGVTASTTTSVNVRTSQPVASFVFSPTAPTTATDVRFNASASSAVSGRTITSYASNLGDGFTATGVTPVHRFSTPGVYSVGLTVTDSAGEVGTTTVSVNVSDATSGSPNASFVFSPTAPTTATLVQFNGAGSTAPTGRTITAYAWNFGDGSAPAAGVTTPHTFATAGTYNVVLTVTDSAGATGTTSNTVTVSP